MRGMISISTLWQEAQTRGIKIVWFEMEEERGLYYQDYELAALGRSIIFLHPKLQQSETSHRTVLLHEMGHDQTSSSVTSLFGAKGNDDLERRNEYLANRWAVDFAIGEERFYHVAREHPNIYEIAEWFGVEPWLAQFAAEEFTRRRKRRELDQNAASGRFCCMETFRHNSTPLIGQAYQH